MVITALLLSLFGCTSAPKENPEDIIKSYFTDVINGDYEGAYALFAAQVQKNTPKEDYLLLQSIWDYTYQLKSFDVEKTAEYQDRQAGSEVYKNVVEFKVTEHCFDLLENKDVNDTYTRVVVNDGGVWKVYREGYEFESSIPEAYLSYAQKYYRGVGVDKDYNQAVVILKESLGYNPEYPYTYYHLGYLYEELNRVDEAIVSLNTCIEKTTDAAIQSDAYNVLGNCYLDKQDYVKAKESYSKALELNPDNEYAKTNLNNISA